MNTKQLNPGARGEHNAGKAAAFDQEIKRNLQQPGLQLQPPSVDKDGKTTAITNDFPARFVAKDGYDDTYALKSEQLARETNLYGVRPQVHMEITKEDLDYAERKRQASNYVAYKQWLMSAIDMSDPVRGKKGPKAQKKITKK